MSKGPGKTQRAIAALIKAEPDGAWAYEHLAERIYGTARFTKAQKSAIGPKPRRAHECGAFVRRKDRDRADSLA